MTRALFKRLFGAKRGLQLGKHPRQTYTPDCDADGMTCCMANPEPTQIDGGA